MPTKVVKYQDFMSFQTLSVAANTSFSQVLTNGISRVRKIIGIPQLAANFNFAGTAGTIGPMNSPFSSSPATSTGQAITNFNVLLSGVQLYAQNYNFSVEHFYQELGNEAEIANFVLYAVRTESHLKKFHLWLVEE